MKTLYKAADPKAGFTVRELMAVIRELYEAEVSPESHVRVSTGFGKNGWRDIRLRELEVIDDE